MAAIETTGWSRFVELFRGDMEAVRDVANVFLDESRGQEAAIRQALDDGDADALRRNAHSLQSTLRQIGARELADVTSRMEAAGKQGDMEAAREQAPDFFRHIESVRAELQQRLR